MIDGWIDCTVDDIKADIPNAMSTGPFGSAISARFFVETGVPVIRGSNLSQDVGVRLIEEGLVFVSEEKAQEFSRSIAKRGDLVFTCWGTIDQVGLIDDRAGFPEFIVSNKQMKLTPDPRKADSVFVYYLFSSPLMRETILNQGIGSSVPGFNLGQLKSITLKLPPLLEQRAIAHVLGTLDDKIELNRRMNETLEAMAQAIFKSWFVDFDPVRAKGEGRDTGLPKHIADLFPDCFEDSELGEIPAGWGVTSFADTVEIIGGGTPKTTVPDYWDGDIPWYSVVDAPKTGDVWVIDTEKRITKLGLDNSSTRILPVGTTIISARGTVGRIALVGAPMAMNQSCYGLRGKLGNQGFFNYFATHELLMILQQHAHGSVFDTITRDTLTSIRIANPPPTIVEAFENEVAPMLRRVREGLHESRALAAVRDALLPKLISGELRVKNADKFVETI